VLSHRAILIAFLRAAKADYFVARPLLPAPPTVLTKRGGQLGPQGCTQLSTVRAVTSL